MAILRKRSQFRHKGVKWAVPGRRYHCDECDDWYTNSEDGWYILNWNKCFYCYFPHHIKDKNGKKRAKA